MVTEKTLIKFGFVRDENNVKLKEVFKNNVKIKELHIDTYPENPFSSSTPFMLLLRVSEKNVIVSNDDKRIIFKKNDKEKTQFMNILFSKIDKCFCKITESYYEFILNVQNIYYKITVLN